MEYYDWNKTFSYSAARWVIVISARRYGKTYGLRKQCVRDYIKKGFRFVEIARFKSEVQPIGRGYFDRLQENNEFPDYEFKYEANIFYIRKVGAEDWEVLGYLLALTDEQILKRITFTKVKRFIFDEGLIEHKDRYKRYLPREFERLVGLRTSVTGENPNNPSSAIVYILGNAVDYTCPYFEALGIKKLPSYGRHCYRSGEVLLDYVEPVYYDEYIKNTVVGRAMADTKEGDKLFKNEFIADNDLYVEKKPEKSKFWRGYVFSGHTFALWFGPDNLCYVTNRAPKNATLKAFTLDDDSIDYDLIRKSGHDAKMLRELFYKKFMRYQSALIRERYSDMLLSLGIV